MQTVSWAQEVSAASVVAYPQLDVLFEGWCCALRKSMDGDNKEHATMGLIAALQVRSASMLHAVDDVGNGSARTTGMLSCCSLGSEVAPCIWCRQTQPLLRARWVVSAMCFALGARPSCKGDQRWQRGAKWHSMHWYLILATSSGRCTGSRYLRASNGFSCRALEF